jgi:WD40 repeat protein
MQNQNGGKMKKTIVSLLFVFLFLTGCQQGAKVESGMDNQADTQHSTDASITQITTQSPTNQTTSPTPSPIPPTVTPSPTAKLDYPVGKGTLVPPLHEVISVDNLSKLQELAFYRNDRSSTILSTKDGKRNFIFSPEGVFIENAKTNQIVHNLDFRRFGAVAISSDGSVISMLNEYLKIVIFTDNGEIIDEIDPPAGEPLWIQIQLSPNGKFLAIDGNEENLYLRIYDIEKKEYVNIPQYKVDSFLFAEDSLSLTLLSALYDSYSAKYRNLSYKTQVLIAPEWIIDKSQSKTFTAEVGYTLSTSETKRLIPSEDKIDFWPQVFTVINQDGKNILEILDNSASIPVDGSDYSRSINAFCQNELGKRLLCDVKEDEDTSVLSRFLINNTVYSVVREITKFTPNGNIKEGQTTIYKGDPSDNIIIGTIPGFAAVSAISIENHTVFYRPILIEKGTFAASRQVAYFDYEKQQMFASFDTAGKKVIDGYLPEGTPYAITLMNNYYSTFDQYNIMFLDGSRENTAGILQKTKGNVDASAHLAMSSDASFFIVVSSLPPTKKDGVYFHHLLINKIDLTNLNQQAIYELPPIPNPDIPAYNINRTAELYPRSFNNVVISPNGELAAISMDSGNVVLVNLFDGSLAAQIQTNKQEIRSLTFSSDGTLLVTMDVYGNIKVFGIQK